MINDDLAARDNPAAPAKGGNQQNLKMIFSSVSKLAAGKFAEHIKNEILKEEY